jgi:hypothetical protein
MKKPEDSPWQPWDRKAARTVTDRFWGDESTDMAGFSRREEDEFLLAFGPRKVRKAIVERRTADMNERQRETFLLMYGSRKERKAIKQRQKAREREAEQGTDGYKIW